MAGTEPEESHPRPRERPPAPLRKPSAHFVEQARSVLQIFTAAGRLEGSSEILGHVRVEGVLPNGDIVLLRSAGQQEIAIYRYSAGA